jgi:hypothetical protein
VVSADGHKQDVFDGTREELRQLDPRKPLDATRMKLMPLGPTKKPLSLAPGKTLEIRVADYIDQIQSLIPILRSNLGPKRGFWRAVFRVSVNEGQ